MSKYSGKKCRLLSMMILTGFFFFVEIVVGYVTNSMALVADSFHMLGDIAALVISFLSVKVRILMKLQMSRMFFIMCFKIILSSRCHQRNGLKTHLVGHVPKF